MQRAWERLEAPATRDHLAVLTGISGSNLSGMNTGRLVTTLETAAKVCAVVPGLSPVDLGAHEAAVAEAAPTALARLEELAAKLADLTERHNALERRTNRLYTRVRVLEDQREPAGDVPKRRAAKR